MRILVVDAEDGCIGRLSDRAELIAVHGVREAETRLGREKFDAVIVDYDHMERALYRACAGTKLLVVGDTDAEHIREAISCGADYFLQRPYSFESLADRIS